MQLFLFKPLSFGKLFPGYSRKDFLFLLLVGLSQCQTKNQTPSHLEAFLQADVIGESSAKDTHVPSWAASCWLQHVKCFGKKFSFHTCAGWSPCIFFHEWMSDYQCWYLILPQNPRDLHFTRHMYVYMKGSQHFWERNAEWMGMRNIPANLNPNNWLETIEARAGSSPRSSLGAEGEPGAWASNSNKLEFKICLT